MANVLMNLSKEKSKWFSIKQVSGTGTIKGTSCDRL